MRTLGKYGGRRTDQILVPGVLGYKPYNLYAIKGSNIAQAKKYAPNGIPGTIVVMHGNNPLGTNDAQLFEYNLKQLGVHTRDEPVPNPFQVAGTRGVDMDAVLVGWCADYYDAYDFINVNLDGRSIRAKNNLNYAYLNSPKLDQQMDHAASLTGSPRAAAYAALDRQIMADYAPWIPLAVFNGVFFVSPRVTNFIYQPFFGEPAFNALAVRPSQ